MFKYNNTHIFTGYLKQFLSSFNLPASRVYTREFVKYLEQHGTEDPRVLESFDNITEEKLAVRINYLKNNEFYNYFWKKPKKPSNDSKALWRKASEAYYDPKKFIPGITKHLNSPGINYDTKTHEYLGDYLRFLRDYHDINLMSLYNCFTDKIYNNIDFTFGTGQTFNSQNPNYRIYALPVKLFSKYTIAIDSGHGIEMFCGLYNARLDMSEQAEALAIKTYQKVNKTFFGQPFLYDKLNVKNWTAENDFVGDNIRTDVFTRWDIANREKDLKLFIKVPTSCKSTITILEGDYRTFNNIIYKSVNNILTYQRNHSIMNFNTDVDKVDLNDSPFTPICQLQLLAFNTGESYPFADRLIEYLSGSAITPINEISDNIKRVQRVMKQNDNYFQIEGLWENKMQNILYDYMINSGPVKVITVCADKNDITTYGKELGIGKDVDPMVYKGPTKQVLKDFHQGYHPTRGHLSKSLQFDILGYADKDVEKLYASWKNIEGKAKVGKSLQNIDIYDGLYDI